ncbi:hypothetical protein [Actinacidiphila oryziradicis]|nr:hypothetical protein [Actinacidiphila oryziradicis]
MSARRALAVLLAKAVPCDTAARPAAARPQTRTPPAPQRRADSERNEEKA